MSLNNMFRIKEQLTKKKPHTLKTPSKFVDMTKEEMDQSGNGPIGYFAVSAISFATCGLSLAAMRLDIGDRDTMSYIHMISGIVGLVSLSAGFCSLDSGSRIVTGPEEVANIGEKRLSGNIVFPDVKNMSGARKGSSAVKLLRVC